MISGERLSETGQWLEQPDGTMWWFDSGALCLDFAYTGAVEQTPGEPDSDRELLLNSADLDVWIADRFETGPADDRDLRDAHALRDAIIHIARAVASAQPLPKRDVDMLNLYAATPDLPPRLEGGSRQAGRTVPRAAQALSTVARDAVTVLGGEWAERVRTCDGCGMIYLDVSRARTRRWCSMQRCGNRHKVRQHRERQRRKLQQTRPPHDEAQAIAE